MYCGTDEDDINNDSDTSSTFSLQECMNEFRARRNRRLSLTQHRLDADKKYISNGNSVEETTEIDFVKQNLCNKEQERKCKPCKNGFCYCFTSDSGDGGNLSNCYTFGNMLTKNSRRNRRSESFRISNSGERTSIGPLSKDNILYIKPPVKSSFLKTTKKTKSGFRAITTLETSINAERLIHITQELRDNCVISRVKVNKHKIKTFGDINLKKSTHKISQRKPHFVDQTEARKRNDINNPTAPDFEQISNLETDHISPQRNKQQSNLSQLRRSTAGELLHKRLFTSKSSYKPRYSMKASQKSFKTKLFSDDNIFESSVSTSSSVRRAELVAHDFLTKKGNNMNADMKLTEVMHSKNSKSFSTAKRKLYKLTSQKTYPSLNNIKNNMELKTLQHRDENVKPTNNETHVISLGWNTAKIKEVHTNQSEVDSMSSQPQQNPNTDMLRNEKPIGWQMPLKVSLDTVDGSVIHNLASNFEDKKTDIDKKLISPSQNLKEGSRKQRFLWSEQLKHLSPWSKSCNKSEINNSKHSLHSGSKAFIISSKNKFISLVSPKKDNKDTHISQIKKVLFRNIGVQTSSIDISHNQSNIHSLYKHRASPHSPPGRYHSPLQSPCIQYPLLIQSDNNTLKENKAEFHYSTNVLSLPKKVSSSSNRKLSFCLYCTYPCKEGSVQNIDISNSSESCNHKKTYRSFNSELDQDESISKISYVLSKIRARLETNDQEVARTFLESETHHNSTGFDYVAKCNEKRIEARVDLQKYSQLSKTSENYFEHPIYSEIEGNSVILSGIPEFDNHTGIRHFCLDDNPNAFYTKVNKSNKLYRDTIQMKEQNAQVPLAKIIKDTLKSKKVITNFIPLPALPEPTESEGTSYYLTLPSTLPLSQSQSLNNVKLTEQNSSALSHQNFSKSDLSLHRNEIFLENFCKNELVHKRTSQSCETWRSKNSINQPSGNNIFGIIRGSNLEIAYNDSVSYELPNDEVDLNTATIADSNMGLSVIDPPYNNQSTPKKQSFVTEEETITNRDEEIENINEHLYKSCPNTPPQKYSSLSRSMNEVSVSITTTNSKIANAMEGYNSLKNALHNSFRKSKAFIKKKGKQMSTSWNFSIINSTAIPSKESNMDSTPDLEDLLSFNDSVSITDQISKTVNICRKLPDMEISMEMVEAERLLLFSALRRKKELDLSLTVKKNRTICQKSKMLFFIDDLFLPVTSHINQDIFFNHFYIITFECGGIIKSTQSSECVNGTAVFRDNGIEFVCCSDLETDSVKGKGQNVIQSNIFMLRLRKISNIAFEPKRKTLIKALTRNSPATSMYSSSSSSTSSSAFSEVVSRFRLHATFTLDAKDFLPYEYVHEESVISDCICIRASRFCNLSLTAETKSTSLLGEIRLKGRAEVRIPKHSFNGFLNVQDPHKQHNWNRRWCTLDGIFLYIWQDECSLSQSPVLSIDLRDIHKNNVPLTCAPSELCARPRSFRLECKLSTPSEDICKSAVFFSADTQNDVDDWLQNLNISLDFIAIWL